MDAPRFTVHAEASSRSVCVHASSAFAALGAYRRLRKARWPVILITAQNGLLTDEAALLRAVSLSGSPKTEMQRSKAAAQ